MWPTTINIFQKEVPQEKQLDEGILTLLKCIGTTGLYRMFLLEMLGNGRTNVVNMSVDTRCTLSILHETKVLDQFLR